MTAERVTSLTSPYQRRPNAMPFFPATMYGCATVLQMSCSSPTCSATPTSASTSCRIWGFFIAAWCAVSAEPNCPGALTLIVRTVCDGHAGGSHLLPHSLLPPQSCMVRGFEQSNHNFIEVMFLTYGIVTSTPSLLPGAVTTWLTVAPLFDVRAVPRMTYNEENSTYYPWHCARHARPTGGTIVLHSEGVPKIATFVKDTHWYYKKLRTILGVPNSDVRNNAGSVSEAIDWYIGKKLTNISRESDV